MKRILCIIDSLISGGAQRQHVGLAKLLHDEGYEVKVIYYHPIEFYKPFLDGNNIPNECIAGANDTKRRIFLIAKAIKKFQPDVIISYTDVPNIISGLVKMFGGKFKLIASERNTTQALTGKERVKFFLMRWADVIVPNSQSQENFIHRFYPNLSPKVTTITNFVDTDVFTPTLDQPASYGNRIVVVGRVVEQKNTIRFIQSVHRLNEQGLTFHVDWYGYHIEDYYQKCNRLLEKYNLNDIFCFKTPTTDIIHEYQTCDLFCLPSIYEGFPNVICEAMSCGKPILCSDICDNANIIEDGKNGFLFNPNSIEDMTDKLSRFLLLSNTEKVEMGEKSRELALQKFSAKVFVNKYIKLIEE